MLIPLGEEDNDLLYTVSLAYAKVVIITFSIVDLQSFKNIPKVCPYLSLNHKWQEIVKRHAGPTVPIVLVGLGIHLRIDNKVAYRMSKKGQEPISFAQVTIPSLELIQKGMEMASKYNCFYYETTIKTPQEVVEIVDRCVQLALWPSKDLTKLFKKEMKKEAEKKKKEQKVLEKAWKKAFKLLRKEERAAPNHSDNYLAKRTFSSDSLSPLSDAKVSPLAASAPASSFTKQRTFSQGALPPRESQSGPTSQSPSRVTQAPPTANPTSLPAPKLDPPKSPLKPSSVVSQPVVKKEPISSPRLNPSPATPSNTSPATESSTPPWKVKLKKVERIDPKETELTQELKKKEDEVLNLQTKLKEMELKMKQTQQTQREEQLRLREEQLKEREEKRNLQTKRNESLKHKEEEEMKKRDQEIHDLRSHLQKQEEMLQKLLHDKSQPPRHSVTPLGLSQSQPLNQTSYSPVRRPPPTQSSPGAPPIPQRPMGTPVSKNSSRSNEIVKWSLEDVGQWLDGIGMKDYKDIFQSHRINGAALVELDEGDLKGEMGIPLGPSKILWNHLTTLRRTAERQKSEAASKIQRSFRQHSVRRKKETSRVSIVPTKTSNPLLNFWDIQWTQLQIQEPIGEGAFGIVYKGLYMGKQVAVKELKSQQLETNMMKEFLLEASIMK